MRTAKPDMRIRSNERQVYAIPGAVKCMVDRNLVGVWKGASSLLADEVGSKGGQTLAEPLRSYT